MCTPVRPAPGRPVRNEWVEAEEHEHHTKRSRLAQERGFLGDAKYFKGRGGDDANPMRRVPSRFKAPRAPTALVEVYSEGAGPSGSPY